jgi:GDP-mannose 6-dehydrogenase
MNLIPHISKMMVGSIEEVMEHAETIVIGNNDQEFREILNNLKADQAVVDLVRITDSTGEKGWYDGICW